MEKNKRSIGPALTLMVLAPLLTEVLPGATRFSSMFVFPVEVCVWGGGALLIRYAVRRWKLGWVSMLFMALALAVAEECLIQQTSLAPMVIRLKGETYARAFGVNYVYFLWALIYEPIFVVFLPVYLTELIFPSRKEDTWISKGGFFAVIPLFLFGSFLAWFSWTRIAREKVFHVPIYQPPLIAVAAAMVAIALLVYFAFSPLARTRTVSVKPLPPGLVGTFGGIWAVLVYGLVLLGFGIAPLFPAWIAVGAGLLLFSTILFSIPRAVAIGQPFALIFGVMLGSMLISFAGFIWSGGPDLYFKIVVNVIAVVLMGMLGSRIRKRGAPSLILT
jgi:hypothetical protein